MRRCIIALALAGCAAEPPAEPPEPALPTTCNGHTSLCSKRFDEVAYATAHNAMSSLEAGWLFANHRHGIAKQLGDGVRGLMLDAYHFEGTSYLCHGICEAGRTPLVDGLGEIATHLAEQRDAVVTIIFESYISADAMAAAFEASGLARYTHVQIAGEPWPTLGELIARDRRLVVFTDREGGVLDWYHDVWAFAFETHFSAESRDDLSCAPNRGDTSNDLFILNHFLTNPVASERWAEQVNHNPFFDERARECDEAFDHVPNFVTVDFYSIGDVLEVVDALNAR